MTVVALEDDLLTVEQVAGLLQITPAALYSLRYVSKAPPAIKVGRRLRFRRSDLQRWIAEQDPDHI